MGADRVGEPKDFTDGYREDKLIDGRCKMPRGPFTSTRGFASMGEDRQREIASKGGRSVPAEKRSFSQDRELASEAGRKGGQSSSHPRA